MLTLATPQILPRPLSRHERDELEILREEVRQLRAMIVPTGGLPGAWKLTDGQRRLVLALAQGRGRCVVTERLNVALYGFADDHATESLKVHVCRVRQGKDRHGLTIHTHRNEGYSMPAEDCARVLAALA